LPHHQEVKRFTRNALVTKRMKQVCGATGYSLALRNCEHLANYIHCGTFKCSQMMENKSLYAWFFKHMMGPSQKLINTPPDELKVQANATIEVWPGAPAFLSLTNANQQALSEIDNDAFNVVVLGPTGSGKSSIINRWFNRTVCQSGAGAQSVTRHVHIIQGTGTISGQNKNVNVIDTIGFCDSTMTIEEVLNIIKHSVKINLALIDKVVFVFKEDRFEKGHLDSAKRLLKWLEFGGDKCDKLNFHFLINRADRLTEEDKVTNVEYMAEQLETGHEHHELQCGNDSSQRPSSRLLGEAHIPASRIQNLNRAVGINPEATWDKVKVEFAEDMLDGIFQIGVSRIEIDTRSCC